MTDPAGKIKISLYEFYAMGINTLLTKAPWETGERISTYHESFLYEERLLGLTILFLLGEVLTSLKATVTSLPTKQSGSTNDILRDAESLLPQYFYATKFYKKHGDKLRLISQFSLGDYLKALDPSYRHPSYKIDLLVTFGDRRIVISYDDFRDKFLANESKDAASYESAEDIYLQKILESYGYKILRLNKFNLGSKPIETLDKFLHDAVKPNSWAADNGFIPKR